MDLLPFFEWCENTGLGQFVRQSQWLFPVIEALHLVALAFLGGAVFIVDLRMLGAGVRNHGIPAMARDIRPWLVGSLTAMIVTGLLLFLSEAVKCYYNTSFWVKMTTLGAAIAFTFIIRERVAQYDTVTIGGRLVAIISIGLWLVVAAAGRWIGFS
jgi:hypothetical protein